MKNSGLRVSATEWNNGRSTSRPTTITAASATAAGARAIATLTAMFPLWPPDSIATSTSSGATARSCSSSAAKLRRPTGAASRLRSASTGMTIAVDDSARRRADRRRGRRPCGRGRRR